MKTASLLYPTDSTLKVLQAILKRKDCDIKSLDTQEGIIEACCKFRYWEKCQKLFIKVISAGNNTTKIQLWVNSNTEEKEKPLTKEDWYEEKFLDTIYKFF